MQSCTGQAKHTPPAVTTSLPVMSLAASPIPAEEQATDDVASHNSRAAASAAAVNVVQTPASPLSAAAHASVTATSCSLSCPPATDAADDPNKLTDLSPGSASRQQQQLQSSSATKAVAALLSPTITPRALAFSDTLVQGQFPQGPSSCSMPATPSSPPSSVKTACAHAQQVLKAKSAPAKQQNQPTLADSSKRADQYALLALCRPTGQPKAVPAVKHAPLNTSDPVSSSHEDTAALGRHTCRSVGSNAMQKGMHHVVSQGASSSALCCPITKVRHVIQCVVREPEHALACTFT